MKQNDGKGVRTMPDTSPRAAADVTLLVCSCDAYEDCWTPFFTLLERYWPEAARYPVILNTESKAYTRAGWNIQCFQLYRNRSVPYGERMIQHLKRVKTPLVLTMLDDFFLRAPVDTQRLAMLAQSMKDAADIACFNFAGVEQPGFPSAEFVGFQELYPIAAYRLNMQAALWRTKTLLSYWKPKATPWTWETFANRKTDRTRLRFYFPLEGEKPVIDYGRRPGLTWGCVRGKWYREDVEPLFEKEQIAFDFSKRGWFDPEESQREAKQRAREAGSHAKLRSLWEELYLGGFLFSCKRIGYGLLKRVFHYPETYDEHLRARYNPGGR